MHILLTGATGFIGGHLLRALVAAGHQVTACGRRPPALPGVRAIACDFATDHRPAQWLPRLAGIDAVINAVGIIRERRGQTFAALQREAPRALFTACETAGVRRVVQVSALGADAEAQSVYHRTKRDADDDLAGRDLDWLILQPSIVYGPGAHSSALFRAWAMLPVVPLVGEGDQPVQPIHIDDLVRAVLAAIEPDAPSRQRIACVGPHPITLVDLLGEWRRWLGGGRLRTLRVPYGLSLLAARVGGLLGNAPVDAAALRMLQRGNRAAVEPFVAAFGFRPRPFGTFLRATPATEADLWHARLYFLRPLLRLTLAFAWIWAGITSALLYPAGASYAMLAQLGLGGPPAAVALYGAAAIDGLLGLALLARYRVPLIGALQIGLMLGYAALITWGLAEWWLHPFGPVAKNVPLAAATLVMMALEAQRP